MRRPIGRSSFLLVITIVLGAICLAADIALDVPHGLRAEYFAADQPSGAPVASLIDTEISTVRLAAAWRGVQPGVFSARWFGFITVWRSGTFTVATTSDDGSSVTIDGQRVVDNGGVHGPVTRSGRIRLARGTYPILVEYTQQGGGYEMEWAWAREGASLESVPAWVLAPMRRSADRVLAARALRLSALALFGAALLLAIVIVPHRPLVQRYPRTASLALFIAMAIGHTWPLASDPAHLSRNDNSDAILNEWILAWVAHQAPRDPARLFDANIFHPEHDTLAYSESMLVQSALAAPVLWRGGTPVLAYSLVLIAGFALTGWTMSLVVARWTGSWTAALVSGMAFAFNAHTLTRIPHLQAQHGEFLPLAVYALDGLLNQPAIGRALRLAVWFTLQSLTSVYLMVFTAAAMCVSVLVRPDAWTRRRAGRVALMLLAAGGVATILLLPFVLPYWRVNQQQGLTRSLADARWYSASWPDYLSTPARLHYEWWSYRFFEGTALFPGGLALLLAAIALGSGRALIDRRARMCLAIGIAGVALSFGPKLPGYAALYEVMPLLRAVRATARFGYLAIFAVAALAGFGVAVLQRAVPARAWQTVGVLLVAIAAIEPTAAPLGLRRVADVPPIYSHLPANAGAVVELPFFNGRAAFLHAPYMLNSTAHWRPLVNGYSGFQPASFHRHVEALAGFPDRRSVRALLDLGVTHVFLHGDPIAAAQLTEFPELSLVESSGTILLYRLAAAPARR
jgi:hypothetical protein